MLSSQLHVDTLLSEISVKYKFADFIADQVFPILPVKKESDLYRVYSRTIGIPETVRANKGMSRLFEMEASTSSYILQRHALHDVVTDEDETNFDMASLRADVTENLTDAILRRREKTVADLFTSTGWSLGVSLAAANAFSANTTVSNPILIYDTAATTLIANSGLAPNYSILPRPGFIAAKNHISVLDRTKYVSMEMTETMLAALFGIDQLLVPKASYNTAAEGVTESISDIWPDIAFIGYKPARPSRSAPSAGYIFERTMPRVKRWREEKLNGEVIEVNMQFSPQIVASLCGYLVKDCV